MFNLLLRSVSISMAISLNSLSDRLLISISSRYFSCVCACFLVWNTFLYRLILHLCASVCLSVCLSLELGKMATFLNLEGVVWLAAVPCFPELPSLLAVKAMLCVGISSVGCMCSLTLTGLCCQGGHSLAWLCSVPMWGKWIVRCFSVQVVVHSLLGVDMSLGSCLA